MNKTEGSILSTFEKIEIFALSNRRFDKLSSDSKFVKIEAILLKVRLESVYFLLYSLFIFYTLFCSLSQNELGRKDEPFVVLGHISICYSVISPHTAFFPI